MDSKLNAKVNGYRPGTPGISPSAPSSDQAPPPGNPTGKPPLAHGEKPSHLQPAHGAPHTAKLSPSTGFWSGIPVAKPSTRKHVANLLRCRSSSPTVPFNGDGNSFNIEERLMVVERTMHKRNKKDVPDHIREAIGLANSLTAQLDELESGDPSAGALAGLRTALVSLKNRCGTMEQDEHRFTLQALAPSSTAQEIRTAIALMRLSILES